MLFLWVPCIPASARWGTFAKKGAEPFQAELKSVDQRPIPTSRDFDRFLLCYFNHILHVSLMHRRDLLEKTGPYREGQRVLIDWDMTRRLAFFTDFLHVPRVTGEFYGPREGAETVIAEALPVEFHYGRPDNLEQEGADATADVEFGADVKEGDFLELAGVRYRVTDIEPHPLYGARAYKTLVLEREYKE